MRLVCGVACEAGVGVACEAGVGVACEAGVGVACEAGVGLACEAGVGLANWRETGRVCYQRRKLLYLCLVQNDGFCIAL